MHLYIAGLYTSHFHLSGNPYRKASPAAQALRRYVDTYLLESYHYIHKGKHVENIRRHGDKVFLDSGAFSSFSLGVTVDIGAYAEFIKENQDIIRMASVLDAIGDPKGTLDNQRDLERRGVQVLPCFHFGEPWWYLEHYIANYEYFTIGGMVPIQNNKLEVWLDELWGKYLTDNNGVAKNKVHGFGLTTRRLMEKYPWYSVDSSSWVQAASTGRVVFPEHNTGIVISKRSPQAKIFRQHFDTLSDQEKEYIIALLGYYGLTLEEVQHDYRSRWALNAYTYYRLGELLGQDHWRKPFRSNQQWLF